MKVVNQKPMPTLPVDALAVPAIAGSHRRRRRPDDQQGNLRLAAARCSLRAIDREHAGELLVGQALVMPTNSARLRYVVVAPTMRVPTDVSDTVNAYLAMRAILRTVEAHNRAHKASPNDQILRAGYARAAHRHRQDVGRPRRLPNVDGLPWHCSRRARLGQDA